jgi:N-acetylglucosamine kinase-like BadF-type ATPase
MSAMDYIIGVDGGGTKTEAVAYDLDDNQIAFSMAGPGNPGIDFDAALLNIKQAISECVSILYQKDADWACRGICLGVAGIEVGQNAGLLTSAIEDVFHCKTLVVHDAVLTHAAYFHGNDGILAIAGTGSVCYGQHRGITGRTGGWGHVLGDEGSGYWIGLQGLKRIAREADEDSPASELSRSLMERIGTSDAAGVETFSYGAGKLEIAALAQVVAESALLGDEDAIYILRSAGRELAVMTVRLYKKLQMKGTGSVAMSGGVLNAMEIVRDEYKNCVKEELNGITFVEEKVSPTKGACTLLKTVMK